MRCCGGSGLRARQAGERAGGSLFSWLRRLWRGLGGRCALFEVATVPRAERRARDPAEIARELQRIDETLHNIEGCILQLQGKLLTLG